MQWTNFYMRSALDTSLLPQDNELKKWSFNASVRDLPLDSTLRAARHAEQADQQLRLGTPPRHALEQQPQADLDRHAGARPTGVGYLVTAPSSSTFDGEHKTTSVRRRCTSTPLPGLDSRLYYNYYDKSNDSTPISYAAGGLRPAAPTNCGSNSATQFCIGGAGAPASSSPTRRTSSGLDLTYRIGAKQKLVGDYT